MKTTMTPIARNSDCQLWSVFFLPEVRIEKIAAQETVALRVLLLLWLNMRQLFSDCAKQVARKMNPITSRSEFWYTRVLRLPALAQRR